MDQSVYQVSDGPGSGDEVIHCATRRGLLITDLGRLQAAACVTLHLWGSCLALFNYLADALFQLVDLVVTRAFGSGWPGKMGLERLADNMDARYGAAQVRPKPESGDFLDLCMRRKKAT